MGNAAGSVTGFSFFVDTTTKVTSFVELYANAPRISVEFRILQIPAIGDDES